MWRWIGIGLAVCMLCAVIAGGLLVLTPLGVRVALWGAQRVLHRDHIYLTWQEASGDVSHPKIKRITLVWPNKQLTLHHVALRWRPWALWHRALAISTVTIGHIRWQQDKQVIPFGQVHLSHLRLTRYHWQVGQLQWRGKVVHAQGHVDIDTRSQQPVSGALHWSIHLSNDYQTQGKMQLSGQWDQYHVSVQATVQQHKETLLQLKTSLVGSPQQVTLTQWKTQFPLWPNATSQATLMLNWQTDSPTWRVHFLADKWRLNHLVSWIPHAVSFSVDSDKTVSQWINQFLFKEKNVRFVFASVGQPKQGAWLNAVTRLSLTTPWGNWRDHEPGQWTYQQGAVRWSDLCLQHHDARFCSQGAWGDKGWQFALHSNALPIGQLLQPVGGATLSGTVTANLDYRRHPNGPLLGQVDIVGKQIALISLTLPTFAMNSVRISGKASAKQWTLNTAVHFPEKDAVTFTAATQLNPKTFVPTTTKGTLAINIKHGQMFNIFVPALYQLKGTLSGHIQFFGQAADPQYKGHVRMQNVSAFWPNLGLYFTKMNTTIATHTAHEFRVTGTMKSGKGTLKWQGHINTKQLISHMQIQLSGSQVLLANTPALEMVASPKLSFTQDKQGRHVTGNVVVNSAVINAGEIHSQARNNPDVVLVNHQGDPIHPSAALPFSGNVTLQVDKNVVFTGFGIVTQVRGKLHVIANAQSSTLANGTLHLIHGHYSAYGKTFDLRHGQLIFSQSPLNNPAIDVTADYQFAPLSNISGLTKLTVGVHVTGTLAQPKLTLYSQPPMSQENILSYIVLGQPLDSVSGSGNNALSQAAALYALRGGNRGVLSRVQDALGLDSISVGNISSDPSHPVFNNPNSNYVTDGSTSNTSAVFIGKSLTNRLYISYGIGVQNNQQEVRARYRLSRYFSLLTDHSTGYSGADLVFVIDY